jgi:hypothetical protein
LAPGAGDTANSVANSDQVRGQPGAATKKTAELAVGALLGVAEMAKAAALREIGSGNGFSQRIPNVLLSVADLSKRIEP